MKYEVGDKVRIKSIDWWNYNNVNNINESFSYVKCKDWNFISDMKKYCGKILTIAEVHKEFNRYKMSEDNNLYSWTDEMIECKVKEETKPIDFTIKATDTKGKVEVVIPDGYSYVIENDKLYFVTEKKEVTYPKTYEECSTINGCEGRISLSIIGKFTRLINARNAYWKIAGQEMGLGKPWEPDWREERYIIYRNQDDIIGGYREAGDVEHHIFEFPTSEMRSAFEENFDQDLEICKTLL